MTIRWILYLFATLMFQNFAHSGTFIHSKESFLFSGGESFDHKKILMGADVKAGIINYRYCLKNDLFILRNNSGSDKFRPLYKNENDTYYGVRLGDKIKGLSFDSYNEVGVVKDRGNLTTQKNKTTNVLIDYRLDSKKRIDLGIRKINSNDYFLTNFYYKKNFEAEIFFNRKEVQIKLELKVDF